MRGGGASTQRPLRHHDVETSAAARHRFSLGPGNLADVGNIGKALVCSRERLSGTYSMAIRATKVAPASMRKQSIPDDRKCRARTLARRQIASRRSPKSTDLRSMPGRRWRCLDGAKVASDPRRIMQVVDAVGIRLKWPEPLMFRD